MPGKTLTPNHKYGKSNNIDEQRNVSAGVVLISLVTLVFGISGHALWTADEPREAEIAREKNGRQRVFYLIAGE